ncbi:MAG: hypothetical protein EBZ69_00500 [Alphaproteobacteria bacterium]|nr:hypothetical protein [Alphaproteobacteria bacterium]
MGFPASLVGRHNYLNALSVLGTELEKPNFPATTTCPACKEPALYVFDDVLTSGLWLFCTACKTHGDIITFGSQIWNTSLPDTLAKFSDLSLIAAKEAGNEEPEYARFLRKFRAAESFWETAAAQVWNHADDLIACRLRELGLRYEINECYGLVGVAHYDQIAGLCRTLGRPKPVMSRADGAAIVYPFYDLPQRLTGLLITQYNETYEIRQNFIPVLGYKKIKPEAGYFLLDKLLETPDPRYRGNQFVSEDIYWVLRAQLKRISRGEKALPIVASYSGAEAESYGISWAAYHSTPRIFHAAAVSPGLISRACNARGYVSVFPPRRPADDANLLTIRAQTKTWNEMLKDTLVSLNEINALSFATRLNILPDKLGTFLNKLDHPFSAGFADRVLAEIKQTPHGPQKRWLIIERDSGWWSYTGRHLCNVCPVITKVIQTDSGEKLYEGTITTSAGETYTFNDRAKRIEQLGLFEYCSAVLTPHKKLVLYDKPLNHRSHILAMELHPPEIVYLPTSYGWDAHNQVFRFDTYEITNTGDVQTIPAWPRKNIKVTFSAPMPVAPLPVREFITPSHENAYVWSVIAAVVGNLVAPILNRDPAPTAVPRNNFVTVEQIAAALCCPLERATAENKYVARGFFNRFRKPLAWPTLVYNTFSDDMLSNIVPRYSTQPMLVRLSATAGAVAPGYGWQTLVNTTAPASGDFSALRHILPAYIQYLLANNLKTFNSQNNVYLQVLKSMHDWLLKVYGASFNLAYAEANCYTPETTHVSLFRELNSAFLSGKLVLLPQPRRRDQPKNYCVQQKEHLWLNRHAVDRYCYSVRSVPPNWDVITTLLQQIGVYTGEQNIHNMNGLLLNKDWCQQFWAENNEATNKETG